MPDNKVTDDSLTLTEINEKRKKIREIMVSVDRFLEILKKKRDFDRLRLSDKLFLVETNVKNFLVSSNNDYFSGVVQFYMETSGVALEGEMTFNSTIWNAEVAFEGKVFTLDDFFSDICDLYYELKKAMAL